MNELVKRLPAALVIACAVTTAAFAQPARVVVRAATVLRVKPAAEARSLLALPVGSILTVVRREGAWLFVRSATGQEGYVAQAFVQSEEPSAKPASPQPTTTPPATAGRGTQPRPATPVRPARRTALDLYGTFDVGSFSRSAKDSFSAVFDTSRTTPLGFGGGVGFGVWYGEVALRFDQLTGQRVFVQNDQVFPLGIANTFTTRPVTVTGGWRKPMRSLTPYVGAGFGSYGVEETSDFAAAGEDVRERFTGYHVLGGVQYRASRWLMLGGEVEYASVDNALESGVADLFDEHNLGGVSVRFKVSVGRFRPPPPPRPAPPRAPAKPIAKPPPSPPIKK